MQENLSSSFSGDVETTALKIPPHSIEAEQAVLGGVFLDKDAWDNVAERVREEDFYRKDHRIIFRAIRELSDEGMPFDIVTVAEWLENHHLLDDAGGMRNLAALAENTPSASNISSYADIVRKRSILRQLIHATTEKLMTQCLILRDEAVNRFLSLPSRLFFEIAEQENRGRKSFQFIKEYLKDALDKVDELFHKDSPITGVSTGFDDLDLKTAGLQPADLIIVAGRPSMGKTAFSINIAEHASIKDKKSVAIFSMEMPGEQLAMRMMSSLGRIDQQS